FCDGIEHACCDSRSTVNILSHQAYDRLLIIAVNFGNFFEVGDQSLWEPFGVHGERHAHFRNGYDIYRRAVKIESFEYGSQKTMDHNATRSHDVHNADTSLSSDGAEHGAITGRMFCNASAFAFNISRIQYIDWNVFVNGW